MYCYVLGLVGWGGCLWLWGVGCPAGPKEGSSCEQSEV